MQQDRPRCTQAVEHSSAPQKALLQAPARRGMRKIQQARPWGTAGSRALDLRGLEPARAATAVGADHVHDGAHGPPRALRRVWAGWRGEGPWEVLFVLRGGGPTGWDEAAEGAQVRLDASARVGRGHYGAVVGPHAVFEVSAVGQGARTSGRRRRAHACQTSRTCFLPTRLFTHRRRPPA